MKKHQVALVAVIAPAVALGALTPAIGRLGGAGSNRAFYVLFN